MNYSIEETGRIFNNRGEIRLEFDQFRSINHVLLTAFGVPLNLLIVFVILTNQRLKKKPRNIIFLGASMSAVFTLLTILVEFLAYHLQSFFLCKVFGLSTKVAYSCLLYNLALALLDRYLAIVRPLFHRKVVTVKNVLITQAIGAVAIFFLFKWPYVFGVVPLQCDFVLVEGKIIAVTNAVLISLIVILNIIVYIKTKHFSRPERALFVTFMNNRQPNDPNDDAEEPQQVAIIHLATTNTADGANNNNSNQQRRGESAPATSSTTRAVNSSSNAPHHTAPLQIHGGNRRMELEATFTLLIGVSSLLIFTAPMLFISFIEMSCLWIFGGADEGAEHCSRIFDVSLPYCREFLLYHLVYNPIMYMIRSKEFYSTLIEKWMRTHRRPQSRSAILNLRNNTTTTTTTTRLATVS